MIESVISFLFLKNNHIHCNFKIVNQTERLTTGFNPAVYIRTFYVIVNICKNGSERTKDDIG